MTVPQLTPAQVAAHSGARIVDVREPDEVATGTIAGSTAIPLGQLADRAGELDPSVPVVTVCQSGRRSQEAAETLAAAGLPGQHHGRRDDGLARGRAPHRVTRRAPTPNCVVHIPLPRTVSRGVNRADRRHRDHQPG